AAAPLLVSEADTDVIVDIHIRGVLSERFGRHIGAHVGEIGEPLDLQDAALAGKGPSPQHRALLRERAQIRAFPADRGWGDLPCVRLGEPALEQECVSPAGAIEPAAARKDSPGITATDAVTERRLVVAGPLRVHAISRLSVLATIAKSGGLSVEAAATDPRQCALSVGGGFGDDVDDAVDGVGAPDRSAGAPDHF